ncbi:MAG: T9SS type A sorting domain-containing protein, partial [Bacteroidota bacterium]
LTPTGTTSINYTGPAQCAVPSAINENNLDATNLSIYPNPCSDILNLKILNSIKETDIKEIAIYSLNGDLVYKTIGFKENISIKQLSQGTYIVKVSATKSELIKRIVVQ